MTNLQPSSATADGPQLLLISERADDERLVRDALESDATGLRLLRVADVAPAGAHLAAHDLACVLLCFAGSPTDALEVVRVLRDGAPRAALVVLGERLESELAVDLIRAGAEDCLAKEHVSAHVLGRVIRYAIERRQAQEWQIEAGELQEAAFLGSPIGMSLQTLDGRHLRVNPALAAILGRDVGTLVRTPVLDIVHPDDHEALAAALADFAAGERESSQSLTRYSRADGGWLAALTSIALIRDARGRPASLFAQVQDITERVNAESVKGRLAAIVESSRDAITATTLDGVITAWNPGAAALYGYTAEEAIGRHARLLIPPQKMSDIELMIRAARGGRSVGPMETRRRRRDGTIIDVSVTCSPIRDEGGEIVGASVIARDISLEKAAQVRLEERERHFRAVFDNSQDAIFIADSHRRYVDANPAACALTDYSLAELRSMRVEDLALEEDVPAVQRAWTGFLRAGMSAGSFRVRRRDGTLRVVEYASTAHIAPDRHLSVTRDVTDRLQAEALQQELEAQLQQARRLESVGQLAGGIAHDFNNLLSVILNYSHFVATRVQDDEELLADVREMTGAAERAAALTRQLLIISRREAVHPQLVDLRDVVTETERLLSRTLGERIRVYSDTGGQTAAVWADRGQLDQVLMNLAVNARDAMPDGGELRLTVSTAVTAELAASPGLVRLTVSDTGAGMSEEVRAHAFEPFFTTKPKGSGTGLGLATVYGIVTQAGGTVALRSSPGRGTSVEVELPAFSQAPELAEPSAVSAVASGAGRRVLVVEDEREVRELTRRILAEHGYEVITAGHGGQALRACRTSRFDLVLTDVVMPGVAGPELADRLRALHPDLRVVYMSGYSDLGPELAERAQLLQKPFTPPMLLAFVADNLTDAALTAGSGGA